MIAKIVDSINTCDEYYEFLDKVRASETYKRGWFVYSDQFDKGDKHSVETMLGHGLTEQEALDVYETNKFAVENSGYDYADIYMYNLYEPYAPVVEYNRLMKQENVRAMQLQEIYNSISVFLKALPRSLPSEVPPNITIADICILLKH